MTSEDDRIRSNYMTLNNKTLSSVSVGWVVKLKDFKVIRIQRVPIGSGLEREYRAKTVDSDTLFILP